MKKLTDLITPRYNEFKELKGQNVIKIFYISLLSASLKQNIFCSNEVT
jgi:hypothetical protein